MTFLVAVFAALAPAMPIRMVSTRELVKIRDYWLRAVLALGALALAWHGEAWLGIMAGWYAIRWRSSDQHPGLITWVAIGATWFLLTTIPSWVWPYLPWVWLAIAAWHVGVCLKIAWTVPSPLERRPLWGLWRTKAFQGSPAITALFFALVAPFCPWWGWPVLAVGLYLTWSWLAFIGVAVGMGVLYPTVVPYLIVALGAILALWGASWRRGVKLFEWTPRGDSFDSVINRLIVWWLLIRGWWDGPRWLGRGPYSADVALRRWSTRCWIELPTGEAFNDGVQHLYEYGVVGVCAVGAFVFLGWPQFRAGDPYTAALAAGAAMSLGHHPFRHPAIGLMLLTIAAGVGR